MCGIAGFLNPRNNDKKNRGRNISDLKENE